MKRYAVIGHPVAHSLSPRIHAAFAKQAGVSIAYTAIDAPDFEAALAAFDGDGANVTLPHKARAAAACATLAERARRAGVVN
ncbi:shikimate dehydrogenase, partial [Luteimonas sp. 8-5]|nr:shikimate dehydrogenase [Luteimonas sp. 8-5]